MATMTMVQAIRSAHRRDARARRRRRRVRRGRRLLRRRVPLHRRAAGEVRRLARVRHADRRGRHRRRRHRHGRLRPASGRGDPVRRLHVSRVRPDRVRRGAAALPLRRRLHRAAHDPHALRRRHLRRADPQPEPGGALHARVRPAHRDAVESLRREGPAHRLDRVRRPGDLPRAQAHLQRPLRRPPRPAARAVVRASRSPKCPRATTRCRWSRRRCSVPARRSPCSPTARWSGCARPPRSETGIDAEIVDLRSLWPLDLDTIVASVRKTGRCVIVHEATRTSGFGAELAALVQEHCFYHLEAPIERVTGWDTPYPHAQEWAYFPGPARVGAAFSGRWRRDGRPGGTRARGQGAGHRRGHRRGRARGLARASRRRGRRTDQVVADVMTDKATVEIPSPVAGRVIWLGGKAGETLPVGSELLRLAVERAAPGADEPPTPGVPAGEAAVPMQAGTPAGAAAAITTASGAIQWLGRRRSSASGPSPRPPCAATRASSASICGAWREAGPTAASCTRTSCAMQPAPAPHRLPSRATPSATARRPCPSIGLRRQIAMHMQDAVRRIPHFTYVEETDVTELEALRARLNREREARAAGSPCCRSSMRAIVLAAPAFPQMNARFDDEKGVVTRHAPCTSASRRRRRHGLMVPVVRHAEARDLWATAAEIARLAEAARGGRGDARRALRLDDHRHEPRSAAAASSPRRSSTRRSRDRRREPHRRAARRSAPARSCRGCA